jgi:hypothetical protein
VEIARLYARRWDIELAFLTLKRELGLHLIWSSKAVVVLAQVWACLIIAQVLQAIRMEVALRAEVDPFEVSLPLLIEALPQFGLRGRDGIIECVNQGRRLGIIRPSTRLRVEAPEIPLALLLPLPKDFVLCRQPRYHDETSSHKPITSEKERSSDKQRSPKVEVHPQRDQIVAILLQREAEIKVRARQERAKAQATEAKILSVKPRVVTRKASKARVVTQPTSPVQSDPGVVRPPWTFLRPLTAVT